ncbi:MAG: hypothetical protein JJT78_16805 [Leptospira sp.]|nr:hypothetical protein [Leptospira sp.]
MALSPQELLNSIQDKEIQKINSWAKARKIVHLGSCNMRLIDQIRTVSYFELRCGRENSNSFIQFATKEKIPKFIQSFKIINSKKIGNKNYIEIEILQNIRNNSQTWNQSNRPQEHIPRQNENKNQNLETFIELSNSESHEKKIHSPMVVFFDRSCPLRYISSNHDFYWDNIILHEFEVTCLKNYSKNFSIRISGDKTGRIPVGNQWVSDIDSGTLFIAHIKLNEWEGERLLWSEPLFYYEK